MYYIEMFQYSFGNPNFIDILLLLSEGREHEATIRCRSRNFLLQKGKFTEGALICVPLFEVVLDNSALRSRCFFLQKQYLFLVSLLVLPYILLTFYFPKSL
jgi:hypothetical protein